ncbi:MAG TPA: hypothetical protein HA254_00240 [Candidatus Diapherotrites archaeon]|uniref:Uncharacterized protein n=1 Tax=Candidatus Iainarchaeum sp. TaxID=3101447 RepID=A0A7J4IXU1_9ARCH|nr:hypothetical protein [Candidatus Diapherotrites archaeon]
MVFGTGSRLKRTIAEKEILRSISALEQHISREVNPRLRSDLSGQLDLVKSRLLSLASPKGLVAENAQLRGEIHGMQPAFEPLDAGKCPQPGTSLDATLRLYKAILSRYAPVINEKEEKTVGAIKALVSKDDLTVQSIALSLSPANYSYATDFLQAAERAYRYVSDEIANADIDIGISFWLTPKEIISHKVADDEDKAIFLCSLLNCLGGEDASCVIAELDDASTHALVLAGFKGNFIFLDPVQGLPFNDFVGSKSEVLAKYSYNGRRIKGLLYKFNSATYEQFRE